MPECNPEEAGSQMSADAPITFALATFGEVLSAYTVLRSDSGRRRRRELETERFPWHDAITDPAAECALPASPARRAAPAPQHAEAPAQPELARPKRGSRHCDCGSCPRCKDNTRWEQIFQEKFFDPKYYRQALHIRYASPLSRL